MRIWGLLGVAALALVIPAHAHVGSAFWPVAKVMRSIDDVRVRAGNKVVRLDSATMLCSGEGRAMRRRGVPAWTHFRCTFTTFTAKGIGPDVEFRVHTLGTRRFAITHARWIAG